MNRLETFGQVTKYNEQTGWGEFVLGSPYRPSFAYLFQKVGTKAFWRIGFEKYYKRRTTGRHSQNNHLWGHADQIAEETGDSKEEVLRDACLRTQGYPFHISKLTGKPSPESTSKATTEQAAAVIETLHRIADFLNIRLIEESDDDPK